MEEYVKQILLLQATGPYILMGYSAGGVLAYEVARALEEAGHQVSDLILLDATMQEAREMSVDEVDNAVERIFTQERDPLINEFLKIETIQNQVKNKVREYMLYLNWTTLQGNVGAVLHYIKSVSEHEVEENRWSRLTRATLIEYQGSGSHAEMLSGEDLKRNVAMIQRILNK